ncbi:MAG: ribonucleotide-diphosphate reductase subunit alpha, partial [Chloroflexota bacterium]
LAVRFLDDVIEGNRYPLPEIAAITRANRKIGLGVMGFADALILLGVPYNSEEGVRTGEAIMAFVRREADAASAALARERGAFLNFKGSALDRPGASPLRNATVTSIAPTGTISIIAGCSSGIEPLFALAYVRNVLEGTRLLEAHPIFEQVARQKGFYTPELMREVARTGSLAHVRDAPEDARRLFVTDFDIVPEWHVRMQAAFQRHVDNS